MYEYKANLLRVIDGDTIEVDVDLGFGVWVRKQSMRLARINAPELKVVVDGHRVVNPAGTSAREWLEKVLLLESALGPITIITIKDRLDKYGRMLVELMYSGDRKSINDEMVSAGFAVHVS